MPRPLTALRVGNFKAFADTQRLPLKPITLVFGPNSAGKSSFIHSLALAHEARFGRDKRGLARLDVRHTDIGGSAIDLGGFRQYVHRGQVSRRVEWGAELRIAALTDPSQARLAELLAAVDTLTVSLAIGIQLDDQDRPRPGAEPRIDAVELLADGAPLLRMSRRGSEGSGGRAGGILRLDRLAASHPVFRQVIKAIIETATTSGEMRAEDAATAEGAIAELLPQLQARVGGFFPDAIELPEHGNQDPAARLFALSSGNREQDLAGAIRFYLPRHLNELVQGIAGLLADELDRLHYLGPLRSFPPRHLAFAEHEDRNWYAGGGYAWDRVRCDDEVREAVNRWLGSDKLKTPYSLVVRDLLAQDQLSDLITDELDDLESSFEAAEMRGEDAQRDVEEEAKWLNERIATADIDRHRELVLLDQRSRTVVTHRDVGIGISQVLPVLVLAYGSQDKIVAMEQPEIHLHPALQAELGDVFIEAALGERGNSFILETHSEHLILRLMRRMRETWQGKDTGLPPVTPDDVAVLYVDPEGPASVVREMPLNEAGELVKAWPGGFFEEGLREQFGDD